VNAHWSVLGGSTAGGAHARAGVSGHDAYAVREIDGTLVLAVADGAGSAAYAAVGASLIVSLAVRTFARSLRGGPPRHAGQWTALLRTGPDRLIRRFGRAAAALAGAAGDLRPADLATTVTVVLAAPPWVAVFAVGDGFVVTRGRNGDLDLLLPPPDDTDRQLGVTTLLPAAGADGRRLVANLPGLTGLAAGTDGLDSLLIEYAQSRPLRPSAAPFGQLFALADGPDELALTRLLAGRQVAALTDDDRTLVLAVPR
jgi:hypothetical protein